MVEGIVQGLWNTTQASTATAQETFDKANILFRPMYNTLKTITNEIDAYEDKLEMLKAPYTPGRELPPWNQK